MPAVWDYIKSRDSKGLAAAIASGSVDVDEEGAVRTPTAPHPQHQNPRSLFSSVARDAAPTGGSLPRIVVA